MTKRNTNVITNPWQNLRAYTPARIALGRTGHSQPTKPQLEFQLAHASARKAVHHELDQTALTEQLHGLDVETISAASRAATRAEYLQRPDLGRQLNDSSRNQISKATINSADYDLLIIVADGLSSLAIEKNAVPFLIEFLPLTRKTELKIAPFIVANQARVALGDEISELIGARITLMLIGERPGLSAPDSMGIYLTYDAVVGTTDEARNCISNIRPEGLQYDEAAERLNYLINEALHLGKSGVDLKDRSLELQHDLKPGRSHFLINSD